MSGEKPFPAKARSLAGTATLDGRIRLRLRLEDSTQPPSVSVCTFYCTATQEHPWCLDIEAILNKYEDMLRELTIFVDDTVYQTLKPMIEQQTIDSFLHEFIQNRKKERSMPAITALRGTLHQVDMSDIRD